MNEAKAVEKETRLIKEIKKMGGLVVAFSGGVDSNYLVNVASDSLDAGRLLAVTATSSTYPKRELEEAIRLAREAGVRHKVITSEELEIDRFKENPTDRCYHCKGELFSRLWEVAEAESIPFVADGSNHDDIGDYRPGMVAAREKQVRSPLKEVGLAKEEVRFLSRQRGLSTWDKPAYACLASRFPYGETISAKRLNMVERAEDMLKEMGFRQVRVRFHGTVARVEVSEEEIERVLERGARQAIVEGLKSYGFTYVALDLEGYRAGSMNEALVSTRKKQYS